MEFWIALFAAIPGTITAIGAVLYSKRKVGQANTNGGNLAKELDQLRDHLQAANNDIRDLRKEVERLSTKVADLGEENRHLTAENLELRRRLDKPAGQRS